MNEHHVTPGCSGGAATHKGIWYQALWCALQATHTDFETSDAGLRLVLEPEGGDAWLERSNNRRVVQLKTTHRETWSLREVVENVLPDLYRAVGDDLSQLSTYEFVSEGRSGRWDAVLTFFESLGNRLSNDATTEQFLAAYESLDDEDELRFGGSSDPFWEAGTTRRRVFDRIVQVLQQSEAANDDQPTIDHIRRKVWHLLARFKFEGDVGEQRLRSDVDAALLQVADYRERREQIRDALVGHLIDKSRQNHTTVTRDELLQSVGLKHVVALGHDVVLRNRCRTQVKQLTDTWRYHADWDVREPTCDQASVFVIMGESGHGKTWRLCAEILTAETPALALSRSGSDLRADLQRAADNVWKGALGHETPCDLRSISARRADVLGVAQTTPWMTIAIDQLEGAQQANALLDEPLEDWGVRVIAACDSAAAEVFRRHSQQHPRRVRLCSVGQFSAMERDEYLHRRIGDDWVTLPGSVRPLLRSPQLAGLYCELWDKQRGWEPRNEYELIEQYWNRLTEDAKHRRDALRLLRLVATVLEGAEYPWNDECIEELEIDDEAVTRMVAAGWLRYAGDDQYEMPHHRLLNFAAAQHLATEHRKGRATDEELAALLGSVMKGTRQFRGFHFGYVPMDWFFLRANDSGDEALRVFRLLRDALDHRLQEALHRKLLPTLGARGFPLLWDSFVKFAEIGALWRLAPVVDGLATQPADALTPRIIELLEGTQPRLQRAALELLARRPTPEALDSAWEIHVRMQYDPVVFLHADEVRQDRSQLPKHRLYESALDALRECARLRPEWVADRIKQADPATEPVHDLAYLCANLHDNGRTWRQCKTLLFEKIPSNKQRSLALNADIWNDAEAAGWLASAVDTEQDILGAAALRALAQIAPARAASSLACLPDTLIYACRSWYLPRLFGNVPAATNDALRRRVFESGDPLRASFVYSGYENSMDAQTLNALLDALDIAIQHLLDDASQEERSSTLAKSDALSSVLEMMIKIARSDLLDALLARQGSRLEQGLAQLLVEIIGPQTTPWPSSRARRPAMEVLRRIGGDGHLRAVNAFLGTDNQHATLDAVAEAVTNHDEETLRRLRDITASDDLWEGEAPLVQMEALKALAARGDARGLVDGALHLGPHIPYDLANWLRPQLKGREQAVERAMAVVKLRSQPHLPGAVQILGVLQHTPAVEDIAEILRNPPDDGARVSAIVALGHMGASSDPAVKLIKQQFTHSQCHSVPRVALLRIGTPASRVALAESLEEHWDVRVAASLAEHEETRAAATELLKTHLRNDLTQSPAPLMGDTQAFLNAASDETLGNILRGLPNLVERVRESALVDEGTFWIAGSKADAIRALGVLDPHTAKLAATKALMNHSAYDRHMYPPLLYGLDPTHARETFLDVEAAEPAAPVSWAMACCLTSGDSPWLQEQLVAAAADRRYAACKLAQVAAFADDTLKQAIDALTRDPVARVRDAAYSVAEHCQRAVWIDALVDQLECTSTNETRAWAILDALIAIGVTGYRDTAWPTWVRRFIATQAAERCPALCAVLLKRLEELRE